MTYSSRTLLSAMATALLLIAVTACPSLADVKDFVSENYDRYLIDTTEAQPQILVSLSLMGGLLQLAQLGVVNRPGNTGECFG